MGKWSMILYNLLLLPLFWFNNPAGAISCYKIPLFTLSEVLCMHIWQRHRSINISIKGVVVIFLRLALCKTDRKNRKHIWSLGQKMYHLWREFIWMHAGMQCSLVKDNNDNFKDTYENISLFRLMLWLSLSGLLY